MIYILFIVYFLLLIFAFSLCRISQDADKMSEKDYKYLMSRRNITILYEASDREWDSFLKKVERIILNETEPDEDERPLNLYESILREHQDQS